MSKKNLIVVLAKNKSRRTREFRKLFSFCVDFAIWAWLWDREAHSFNFTLKSLSVSAMIINLKSLYILLFQIVEIYIYIIMVGIAKTEIEIVSPFSNYADEAIKLHRPCNKAILLCTFFYYTSIGSLKFPYALEG